MLMNVWCFDMLGPRYTDKKYECFLGFLIFSPSFFFFFCFLPFARLIKIGYGALSMCDTYRTKHWKCVFVCMDQSVRIRTSIYQLNIANEFNAQAQNIFQYQLLWVAIYLLVALVVHRRFSSAHSSFFPHHRIGLVHYSHSILRNVVGLTCHGLRSLFKPIANPKPNSHSHKESDMKTVGEMI